MTTATQLSAAFEIVTVDGKQVGSTFRSSEGVFAAELYRPRAETNKPLGDFPSRRQAQKAVLCAARSAR